jgi:plasmid stabilization system protein ParE
MAVEHIRRDSPSAAETFLQRVFTAVRSLPAFPERGRVVPELEDPSVREIFVDRFRILYEPRPNAVWIVRMVHGSRDLLLALGRKSESTFREDAPER